MTKQLTGITHRQLYGTSGLNNCEGWIEDAAGHVFAIRRNQFGSTPTLYSIDEARAMALVLSAIVAEYDAREAGLTAEYGPLP
jgi:hypothetical protein